MKIDTHAHIFLKNLSMLPNARYYPNYNATIHDYLSCLERNQINKAVLVQPSFLGTNNSFLLESIKDYQHLKAIIVVDENISYEELQLFKDKKACGVRLNLLGKEIPNFHNKTWRDFFSYLSKLNMQVEIQRDMKDLYKILEQIQDINCNIVIDHLGRANEDKIGLKELLAFSQSDMKLWFKVSGFYRATTTRKDSILFAREIYENLKEHFGISCFVFGSDFPHTNFEDSITYKATLEAFSAIVNSTQEQEQILGDNAMRLFDF